MRITFDPAKRERTWTLRGLAFEDARAVFAGETATREDMWADYGEVRFITAGWLKGAHGRRRVDAAR